jgi:hypothetical protein
MHFSKGLESNILSRVPVLLTYRLFLLEFFCTLYIHISGLPAIQRYRYSTHFQSTVAHALGFSVFTSLSWQRIYHSLTVTSNYTLCLFFQNIIPFLPIFCNCHFRRLDSIQFPCSEVHIPVGWRPETQRFTLDYCFLICRVFCVLI